MNAHQFILTAMMAVLFARTVRGDEFPWVWQIEFQDSITWVVTNDGLYKIVFSKGDKISWNKENEATQIFKDSKNSVWATDYANVFYVGNTNNTGWTLLKNDTIRYIRDFCEYDSEVYILASVKGVPTCLKWNDGKWITAAVFSPVHEKACNRATSMIVDKDGINIKADHYDTNTGRYVWHVYNFDPKNNKNRSTKWQVRNNEKDLSFRITGYNPSSFGEKDSLRIGNRVIPPYGRRVTAVGVKDNEEVWIGGYSFAACYRDDRWIQLCFLTPIDNWGGDEGDEETVEFDHVPDNLKCGIINDVDGYVNVSESPDQQSNVIAKILDNVKFQYEVDLRSDWRKVHTECYIEGFVHKSRIKECEN